MSKWFQFKYIIKVYRKARSFGYISHVDKVNKSVNITDVWFRALALGTESEAESIVGVLLYITPRDYAFLIKKKLVVFVK